ncbi:MAG: hypothetical protein ACJ75B_12385 [Flavisolibacter sp.]
MKNNILLIEDDQKKIDDIKCFISEGMNSYKLVIRQSYQSGLKELLTKRYDLLLLDMSLPTWDSMEYEAVGNFEKFGGYKIMMEMERKKVKTKTILITMFDDFGESDSSMTLMEIDSALKESFKDFYLGYVFYNSRENNWMERLRSFISTELQG